VRYKLKNVLPERAKEFCDKNIFCYTRNVETIITKLAEMAIPAILT
jgi:hypothetical protein